MKKDFALFDCLPATVSGNNRCYRSLPHDLVLHNVISKDNSLISIIAYM